MSSVPRSVAARIHAWATESLVARAVTFGAGLVVLAFIGRSALAGSPSTSSIASASPAPSVAPAVLPPSLVTPSSIDAGVVVSRDVVPTVAIEELPASSAPAVASKPRATPGDPVDINAAELVDLRRLPGVGAKRAEAILALRAHLPGGRFHQIEDLLKVKGIGRAMLRKLQPLVRITP